MNTNIIGSGMTIPTLYTGNDTIDKAFRIAMGDLFSNVKDFNISINNTTSQVILAGLNYNRPWTRDASINSWNAASLIMPDIAKNTLLAVLTNENELRIGGQYWDAVIWITGAWNHYLVTGDKNFLEYAHKAAVNSLNYLEAMEFNKKYNLFRGLGWSDGVAAYEGKYAKTNGSSAGHSWPQHNPHIISKPGYGIPMMALSTNCLYYNAYILTSKMEQELKLKNLDWEKKALDLKEAINLYLWDNSLGMYKFYIDEDEESKLQETIGNAYAILFGIADQHKIVSIFKNQFVAPAGVPCGWPPLKRYQVDCNNFPRHNAVVWPQIQGFWAQVAAIHKKQDVFFHEMKNLAKHAVRDMQFAEIYHPYSGQIYGGMQEGNGGIVEWQATNRQTWSATSYLRMVIFGLTGLKTDTENISFSPCVPNSFDKIMLKNLRVRNVILDITIVGSGTEIKRVTIDGKETNEATMPIEVKGTRTIVLELN